MILRKKRDGYQPQTKIEKRVAKTSTQDLIQWMEHYMFIIGKHITSWQRSNSDVDLEEVNIGAEAFLAIAKELKRRSNSKL
jgi:hypothetical protein